LGPFEKGEEMKSGWQTTEFWGKLIATLTSLAVGSGAVKPQTGQIITDTVGQALPLVQVIMDGVIQLTGLISGVIIQLRYAKERAALKAIDLKK
jgi:hypothetical protein